MNTIFIKRRNDTLSFAEPDLYINVYIRFHICEDPEQSSCIGTYCNNYPFVLYSKKVDYCLECKVTKYFRFIQH